MIITGYYIGSELSKITFYGGTANITTLTVITKELETVNLNVILVPIKRLMLHLMTVVDIIHQIPGLF